MTDVKFSATSDFEKVKKDYEQLARHTAKVEAENQKLKRTTEQTGSAAKRSNSAAAAGLQRMKSSLAGVALQYVGISQALALWNRQLEHNKRMAEESAAANISAAQSQAAVIKNIGDVSDESAKKFLANVAKISREAGMPSVVPLNMTASSVLSAVGGDQATTLEILGVVSQLFRDQPEQMAPFGGAMGDVMKASDMNARQAAAFMMAAQGQARFENLEAFKEVAPTLAAASVMTRGDRVQNAAETAALFAGIGSRSGDVEGAITKGAVANLVRNLESVAGHLDTTFERLEYVRERPELQAEVLKSGFRGPTVPVVRELLAGSDTQTAQMVVAAFDQIRPDEAAFARKVDQLARLTPQLQLTGASQRASGNVESIMLTSDAGREAVAREIMTKTLDRTFTAETAEKAIGTSILGKYASEMAFMFGQGDPEERAIRQLERRIDVLLRPELGKPAIDVSAASPTTQRMVQLLEEQIMILRQMRDGAGAQNHGRSRSAQQERVSQVAE